MELAHNSIFARYCCPECGVQFGIQSSYSKHLTASGKPFYCPNGHELEHFKVGSSAKEQQFAIVRGENEMLKAQVQAKETALKDVAEELTILRGLAKRHTKPTPTATHRARPKRRLP